LSLVVAASVLLAFARQPSVWIPLGIAGAAFGVAVRLSRSFNLIGWLIFMAVSW
jgi:hypothetical protein